MKLAYVISAYKLPEMLVRLVRRLDSPRALFLIHVDRKTEPEVFERMRAPLAGRENVVFLPRHLCHWGDFGHVRATLKGIRHLVDHRIDFRYAILLTGQDYPIKPVAEIERFFLEDTDREFIVFSPMPRDEWKGGGRFGSGGMDRIERWHFRLFGRPVSYPGKAKFDSRLLTWIWAHLNRRFRPKRRFPAGFRPYGGNAYWCLTRECVRHIHDFVSQHRSFVRFFHHVRIPDEIFIQTIVGNSPFAERAAGKDLRFVDWDRERARAAGTRPPAVLDSADLPRLAGSSALFARKFDSTVSAGLLDAIDRELLATECSGAPG